MLVHLVVVDESRPQNYVKYAQGIDLKSSLTTLGVHSRWDFAKISLLDKCFIKGCYCLQNPIGNWVLQIPTTIEI